VDLYNRIRPRKFENMYRTSDFLANITARVEKALKGEEGLSHAFMFYSEEPGLGKTTCARILASELNPSLSQEERNDVFFGRDNPVCIHINAGESGKVDNTRDLIERITSLAIPMYDYKYVFIIDEVHKLTDASIDALLAPTENISENVYIIMTTTDIGKLNKPKTPGEALLSRCESHRFYTLKKQEMVRLVENCAKAEGTKPPESRIMEAIYTESSGRPRKALVLLSQYMESGTIGTIEEGDDEKVPHFKELIDMYCGVATGKKVSWSNDIAPLVRAMLSNYNAEELRIKLLHRLFSVLLYEPIKGQDAVSMAKVYSIIGDAMRGHVGAPQKSELVTRLYSVYIKAFDIKNKQGVSQ
jgi:replication-associated recombination protein RarA